MTNLVLLVHNRVNLTRQALASIVANTTSMYTLLIVADSCDAETLALIEEYSHAKQNIKYLTANDERGCIGALRNVGAKTSEWTFGRGNYICFLDNDVYVMPNWIQALSSRLMDADLRYKAKVLGGNQHPYHGTNADHGGFHECDAVAGYSMFMSWATWDKYGMFDATQKGIGASEDWAFCQRVIADGGKVGYIHPAVLHHCGITGSNGNPATGAEAIVKAEGILYE